MSLFDYKCAQLIEAYGVKEKEDCVVEPSFYALIMAAMRKADSVNAERLRHAFPDTWREFRDRYNAPGGKLPGEP